MNTLYSAGIVLYTALIRLSALFSPKARLWLKGRAHWRSRYAVLLGEKKSPRIWVHAASLGEFEQGRPFIEAFRTKHPDWEVVLTFFSPSGYEIRKNHPLAHHVLYLPADTPDNARDFTALIDPDIAVFVKYEFWANYLSALHHRNTPTLLISALFRPSQPFFKPWGAFWRQMLDCFSHVFVQNQSSYDLLHSIGYDRTTIAGDTRVDRVLDLVQQAKEDLVVAAFAFQRPTLIVGSSWYDDEKVILPALLNEPEGWKLVIAPHEPSTLYLEKLEKQIAAIAHGGSVLRYSVATPETAAKARVLIIDNVGLLNTLYRYGTAAYIGGGFGKGIHNTLEPAAWGLPILFGPKHEKFEEAREFVATGGAFVVHGSAQLVSITAWLSVPQNRDKASAAVGVYLMKNKGATTAIMAWLGQNMPELR